MCVNCLSAVDAAMWASAGMACTATTTWHRLRDRLRAGTRPDRDTAEDVAALLAEFEDAPASTPRRVGLAGFAVALAVYVVLGLWLKTVVVNWIVGPLFPLVLLGLLPEWLGRRRPARLTVGTR